MKEEMIYVAVVDGKVSHLYADRPLRFQVVAWETGDPASIRIDPEVGNSTEKDKLVKELFHLVKENPYDDTLVHRDDAGEAPA